MVHYIYIINLLINLLCLYTNLYITVGHHLVCNIHDSMNTDCQYRTLVHHHGKGIFDAQKHQWNLATWARRA